MKIVAEITHDTTHRHIFPGAKYSLMAKKIECFMLDGEINFIYIRNQFAPTVQLRHVRKRLTFHYTKFRTTNQFLRQCRQKNTSTSFLLKRDEYLQSSIKCFFFSIIQIKYYKKKHKTTTPQSNYAEFLLLCYHQK